MGWAEGTFDFPCTMKKEQMMMEVNESLENERGRYDPTPQPYLFLTLKEPLADYDSAEDFLFHNKEASQYYRRKNVAVQYYESVNTETKKIQDLKRRIQETEEKAINYHLEHSVVKFKADFVGCPHCNSKINKKYLDTSNKCCVCGVDMSSETTKNTMAKYNKKISELKKKLKEEEKKSSKKGEVRWLIYAQLYIG